MIGFWNYTVILTYISLLSAVFGITQVFEGTERSLSIAFLCLLLSGICDLFDGKVARHKKDRTDQEKVFGIQIDSLADLVCFGVLPAVIGYQYGFNYGLGLVSALLIVLCGLIRLGYFNVMEEERQRTSAENRKEYQGLPITTSAIVLPLLFMGRHNIPKAAFPYVFQFFMLALAVLFVLNIRVKKISAKSIFIMFTITALIIFGLVKLRQ
ncbi:MAG: CDP-alcohol phosphatidyltransferase family protein [Ruminococcus sp.]|nr:CDP-alcohol phosphatidyltransferase family protein [Ruminococcus sp.]